MKQDIAVKRKDLVEVLKHLELLVVGLDRVGSELASESPRQVEEGFFRFSKAIGLFARLAECRSVLSSYFSRELGPDDMDELDREFKDLKYWGE